MAELLKKDIEAYRANSDTQPDWDIVAVLPDDTVKRIQVKTTFLQNKSKNNSVDLKDRYDFLVLVVIDEDEKFFILSKDEVEAIKGTKLSISCKSKNGLYKVKDEISPHISKWEKIA